MNNQKTSYGAKDKRSSLQWIRIQTAIAFLVRTNWTPTSSASGSHGRQADRRKMAGFQNLENPLHAG